MTVLPAPFAALAPGGFDVIVADPPWRFQLWNMADTEKSAGKHYELMTTDDVAALPVGALAANHSTLYLWTSAPMLLDAVVLANAWGFPKYISRTSWRKTYPSGKQAMGCGYWVRTMHEDVLIFTRGKPQIAKAFPSLFDGVRREHSRKPNEFYTLLAERTPGARRVDLFSRESRPGFVGWGNEHGKFDEGQGAPDYAAQLARHARRVELAAALQARLVAFSC